MPNMFSVRCCFGVVALIAIFGSSYGQNSCSTTSPETQCVSLTKCAPFLKLVSQSGKLTTTELKSLRNSQCGSEGGSPKVCCPIVVSQEAETQMTANMSSESIPDPPDVTNHKNLGMINGDICGPITEVRIIQGNKSEVMQYPWMALISYEIKGQDMPLFACGGTLISKRYVLTAAHCVTELGPRTKIFGVRLGEHDISKEMDCSDDSSGGSICADKIQDFEIDSFHVHGDYRKAEHRNDIALVRLDRDADLEPPNVRPICLPVGNVVDVNLTRAIVTGWGLTEAGIRSQVLLRVSLRIASNDDCNRIYSEKHNVSVTYKQFCAGGNDRKDSCTGDSGGPLQYPGILNGFPKYVQYGIISFGTAQCGVVGYPGVYTKVSYYMDWILDTMKE